MSTLAIVLSLALLMYLAYRGVTVLLLVPVLAVALGVAFWGDRPGPRVYLGGAMVLGGVLIIALRARAKALSTH